MSESVQNRIGALLAEAAAKLMELSGTVVESKAAADAAELIRILLPLGYTWSIRDGVFALHREPRS